MTNIIGRIDELTKEERRALRTRARMQRKLANGVKLCGAKTRLGRPCIATGLAPSGRCRNHGGASTGAKTPEGRAKCLSKLKQFRDKKPPTEGAL
jgi:hypothetical protein